MGDLERDGGKAVGEVRARRELDQPHDRVGGDEGHHDIRREVAAGGVVADGEDHERSARLSPASAPPPP